jgi:hypothetical protein
MSSGRENGMRMLTKRLRIEERLRKCGWYYLAPIILAVVLRLLGAAWIFSVLNRDGSFQTHWMDVWLVPSLAEGFRGPPRSSWLYLFHAWDSGFYVSIARNGYYHPAYAFLPGYPSLIALFGWIVRDYWIAAFLVSLLFGLGSLLIFQRIAESYMNKKEAVLATLLFAAVPQVALFTTLAYSEGVFLFASLSAWYMYRKGRMLAASLFAALAALTKSYGLFIIIPLAADILRGRKHVRLLYLLLPTAAFLSWLLYCYAATGNPLASWTDESYWMQSGIQFGLLQTILSSNLSRGLISESFTPDLLLLVAFFGYLAFRSWTVDKILSTYAITLFVVLVFIAPTNSLVRYLSFIFPVWLNIRLSSSLVVLLCLALFVPLTLVMWLSALQRLFIG